MAGTHASGRPGGNPGIAEWSYKLKGNEPLDKVITVRLPARLYEKVRGERGANWQDDLRAVLEQVYGGE
jgi:hypothetical protein